MVRNDPSESHLKMYNYFLRTALIKKAEDENWVDDLIKAAYKERPENEILAELSNLYQPKNEIQMQVMSREKPKPSHTIRKEDNRTIVDGRYVLEKKLGEGRIGIVYKAEDTFLQRNVAIRLVQQSETLSSSKTTTIMQDARVVAGLTHPHLIEIFDYDDDDPQAVYVVMEYMEGGTLEAKLSSEGALPLNEVKDIVSMIAPALIEAHDQGVVLSLIHI